MTILGIGYAAVSLDLTLDGDIDGVTQDEVFITNVRLKSDASNGEMKSHSFISSVFLLDKKLTLSAIISVIYLFSPFSSYVLI